MQCCSLIEMLLSTTVIPKDKRSNSRKPEKVIQLHNIPTKQRGNWNLEHLLFYFIFQISLQNLKTEVDLCGAFKLICDHSFSLGITRTIIKMTSECDPHKWYFAFQCSTQTSWWILSADTHTSHSELPD